MSKRYGTLDVSLNMTKSGSHKLNKTIEAYTEREEEDSSKADNDQKVNKFKELYYKNERLRRQLKTLNEKLNEKLQKLKLPSVKRKTMSVDLNKSPPKPPSKALARELENGYKQIAMYKKQVEVLKGKEETPENYQKLRNTQNMINYMDLEINRVQEELKSIKNIRKIQQKALSEDVDNIELKQRTNDYQREIKSFRDKIKEIDKKARKRQTQFKKQQAYLVALKQKIRKYKAEQQQLDKPEPQKPKDVDQLEFNQAKEELRSAKLAYEASCKKVETLRVHLKNIKQNKNLCQQQYKDKEALYKLLLVNVESYTRLLKDLEIKKYQQTGVRDNDPQREPLEINKILKLQEIEDDPDEPSQQDDNQAIHPQKLRDSSPSVNRSVVKDEREWKGKMRKVSRGYAMPTDTMFQESGILLGFKAYLDENKFIVGLLPIMLVQQTRVEAKVQGNTTNMEIKWEVTPGDHVSQIIGSFTEQGYLAELVLKTWGNATGTFGSSEKDGFQFKLEYGEYFSGIFGGLRRLGQDVRFTQIGFWIWKM